MKKKLTLFINAILAIALLSGCGEKIGEFTPETDFLAYAITESNHPALEEGVYVYMMRTPDRECFYYRKTRNNPVEMELICKGSYDVDVMIEYDPVNENLAKATPFLTLSYPSDEEENFADPTLPGTAHRLIFDTDHKDTRYDDVMLKFEQYLAVDWTALVNSAVEESRPKDTKVIAYPTLATYIENTDYHIIGELVTTPEPPAAE